MDSIAPSFVIPAWPAPASVGAAFSTRLGGVSQPPFDTLNLSTVVPDSPDTVLENRRRLAGAVGLAAPVCWLRQVHGTTVLDAAQALQRDEPRREADGCVTDSTGVVCAVMAADCLPVLLCHRDGSVVGGVHAGWRGLAAGVVEAGVAAMGVRGAAPGDLLAWLGPCIGASVYEVGDEVRAAFDGAGDDAAFVPSPAGRWLADLPALARLRLAVAGVTAVFGEPACTFTDDGRFFSHRRDGPCGRMAALIWRT